MAAIGAEKIWETADWASLKEHVAAVEKTHLRELLKVSLRRAASGPCLGALRGHYPNTIWFFQLLLAFSLQDEDRSKVLQSEYDGIFMDFSRQRVTRETLDLLQKLAEKAALKDKIAAMAAGKHINVTEDRAVGHMALRAPADAVSTASFPEDRLRVRSGLPLVLRGGTQGEERCCWEGQVPKAVGWACSHLSGGQSGCLLQRAPALLPRITPHCTSLFPPDPTPLQVMHIDGVNVVPEVHSVLERIKAFSGKVRAGEFKGVTGKALKNVISVGIGGSYLGVEFVYEALRKESTAGAAAEGRTLRFLANVDPVDISRACEGLNPEETLVVVISKTFTTAETILNAKSLKEWLVRSLTAKEGVSAAAVAAHHIAAVSTNIPGEW